MYKLGFKEAEVKLPTFNGSFRKQGSSPKTSTSASLTTLKPMPVWITKNWKILKEIGIPDHLICLLRNLYMGEEATATTRCGTMDMFKIYKWYVKAVHCHPAC